MLETQTLSFLRTHFIHDRQQPHTHASVGSISPSHRGEEECGIYSKGLSGGRRHLRDPMELERGEVPADLLARLRQAERGVTATGRIFF